MRHPVQMSESITLPQVSQLLRGVAANRTLRVLAADTTDVVREAQRRHQTSPTATAALGRALSASLLLAQIFTKPGENVLGAETTAASIDASETPCSRVALRFEGGGPIGYLIAEGSIDGSTRGYARYPEADVAPRFSDGKLDVGALVGQEGELAVTRLRDIPYTGSVPLVSGEIAEDVAAYLQQSEQIASALLLGVYLEPEAGVLNVAAAGGVLVQALPGVRHQTLDVLEENVRSLGPFTTMLHQRGLSSVLEHLMDGLALELFEEPLQLHFRCRCSRARAKRALQFFTFGERAEMIDAGGQEVVCHWCAERYLVTPDEIRDLRIEDELSMH